MEQYNLMQFFDEIYSKDISYCALCLRSGEDVRLSAPLVFRKVLGALKYLNSFHNDNICYMCESRAAAVCRFVDMMQLALEIQIVFQKSYLTKGKNKKKLAVEGAVCYQSQYAKMMNRNLFSCTQILHVDAVENPEEAKAPIRSTSEGKIKKPPPDDEAVVIEDDSSEDSKEPITDGVQTDQNQSLNMPMFFQMLPVNTVLPHGVYLLGAPATPNQANDATVQSTPLDNSLSQKISPTTTIPAKRTPPIANTPINNHSPQIPKTRLDDKPQNLKTSKNLSVQSVKTKLNNFSHRTTESRLHSNSPEPVKAENRIEKTPETPENPLPKNPTFNRIEPFIPLTQTSQYDNPPTSEIPSSEDNPLIRKLLLRPPNPPKLPKTLKLHSAEKTSSVNSGPAKKRQKQIKTEVIDDDVEIISCDLDGDEDIANAPEVKEDKALNGKEPRVDWEEVIPVGVIGIAEEDSLPGTTLQDATKDLLKDLQNVINMSRTE